ncbi:MAG: hypothetical protein LKJ76_03440 [Lachnospiraceae bacterium]|nr:hypothetical protein [Lachnospiraceae bacterium]
MNKTAIIFPGIGYTCKRPLLSYTASMAGEHGYTVIRLDYGEDIHSLKCRDASAMEAVADKGVERALSVLEKQDLSECGDILMISKSVGTVIAVRTAQKLGIADKTRHFMITPIPATLPCIAGTDCVFVSGTGDPYITADEVRRAAAENPDKVLRLFEGCNHSLEQEGHTLANLHNLEVVVRLLEQQLR